jgi:hypothetical protein
MEGRWRNPAAFFLNGASRPSKIALVARDGSIFGNAPSVFYVGEEKKPPLAGGF